MHDRDLVFPLVIPPSIHPTGRLAWRACVRQEEQFKTEQELWEEQQVGVASFRPGAKDKGKKELRPEEAELEEFLFENQIDFVSDQVSE